MPITVAIDPDARARRSSMPGPWRRKGVAVSLGDRPLVNYGGADNMPGPLSILYPPFVRRGYVPSKPIDLTRIRAESNAARALAAEYLSEPEKETL